MEYIVSDIIYDTEGEDVDLPKEIKIEVPDTCKTKSDRIDFIGNYITETTGFCHFGFTINK